MSVDLPKSVAAYIAAENGDDTEPLAQCFADQAVVRDEGQTIEGLAAIKLWKAETRRKYQHTIEPLASIQKDGNTVVTNRLKGKLPGSPVEFQFASGSKAADFSRELVARRSREVGRTE